MRSLHTRSAVVIGAGGLGCPVSLSLAEAGVGRLVLVDPDVIELSNLQRQVLYRTQDVGQAKVEVAAERLRSVAPDAEIVIHRERLTAETADDLLRQGDVVVDATDDPEARFLINDRALALGIPAVIGGVIRFEGLVMGVHPDGVGCFRCLFESPPSPGEVPTCAAAGVLGAMAGVVGHLQAQRALGLLAGDVDGHTGYVTTIDGWRGVERDVPLPDSSRCRACAAPRHDFATSLDHRANPMSITIKIPTSLRRFADGQDRVVVDGSNVRDALDGLDTAHPGIKAKLCDDAGNLRRFINVYANQEDIRFLDNLDTALTEGAEIQIVPAIAGG